MDDSSINQEFTIIGEMIHYYQWLFDVSTFLLALFVCLLWLLLLMVLVVAMGRSDGV